MTDLAYDLHLHTSRSFDGVVPPRALVRLALRRGLSGIAVTDHNTVRGGMEAARHAPDGFLVIVGAEIATSMGDIIGLFLAEEIRARDALEVVDAIHAQGGVAVLPHPAHGHARMRADVLAAVDAYEVLNARAGPFDPASDPRWGPLAPKTRLASSDAHLPWEVGKGRSLIPGPATPENVKRRLLAGDVVPTGGRVPRWGFYLSQTVRLIKTRDLGMVRRFVNRRVRRLAGRH